MMKNTVLAVLFLCLSFSTLAYSQDDPVTIVYNKGIAPIKFTDSNGNPSGLLNEYWKLLSEQTGIEFDFSEVESFRESLSMVKHGQVDLHAGIFHTDERGRYLAYSHPIFDLTFNIYSTPDVTPPASLEKTRGFLVGVVAGGYPERFIEKIVPASHIIRYRDYKSMFSSVLDGELKVFVSSDIHLHYYLSVNNLANPFKKSDNILFEQTYYGATAIKNQALIEKIRQAQNQLIPSFKQQLKERWLNFNAKNADIPHLQTLTPEEIHWIRNHPVLKVTNEMNWPPFDFNKQGQPQGFSIDLLNLISKRVGLRLEYVHGYSWNDLQDMLRQKKIDIIHSLNRSDTREEFIRFTDAYISNQTVIVTRKDNSSIKDASDLHLKTIAVIDGYNQKRVLEANFEGINFLPVDSPLAALRAVSSGQADATIRFNAVANYHINHHLLTNLKYIDEFKIDDDNLQNLHLGVRKDWPVLQQILQKGLRSVSREEMHALKQKWILLNNKIPKASKVSLTQEEREWLKEHPQVTLGADFNWPPFDFTDSKGAHSGMASDYISLIEQRSGLKITVQPGVWSEILARMKNGELDGLACAVATSDRAAYLDFSTPYLSIPSAIVTKSDNYTIRSLDDLRGKAVSVNRSSYMHEFLEKKYPEIKLHLSSSNEESIEAVSYGEADAYIGNLAVASYIIRKRLLTNLKVVKKFENMQTRTSIAIDKSQPVLMSIVQKVLDGVTEQEHSAILDKWYVAATEKKVALTDREHQWVKQHPVIRISGDPAWAPMSFLNAEGKQQGVIPDFFKLIEQRSGLKFETVVFDSWSEALEGFRKGKTDIIDAITENSERGEMMDFTDVYMTADVVIITRDDIKYLIRGLDNIGSMQVGSVSDYITESYIREDYPELDLKLYPTASDGLKALSAGDVDVFIIDIPTFEYNTKKSSLANLKISGLTPYAFKLSIGVHKEDPELVSILNKTLGQINQKETNEIYNDWVTLKQPLIDYSLLGKAGLAACLCLAAIGYWNRRLAHEVSLRKSAEETALQAARAKSDFLANMSHEIRTPMNSVLGFAELLDNIIIDPEQKSYLKSIRTSGKSLLGIINDILDLSKIEAGKMSLKPEPVSMQGVFEEMSDFFKIKMEQKNLAFGCELEPGFPPYVLIDPTRLRQILINLIGNGLKFTESGSIDLIGTDVRISESSKRVSFSIVVTDTGIGIREEQQEIIFDKFQQQEGLDNSRYGGTGLGLSICKSLMTMMGGTIGVKSIFGKGSSFILHFPEIPVTEEETERKYQGGMTQSGFDAAEVLVVDDIEDNRALLAGFFKDSAIRIHQAANGREAMKQLRHTEIDLVFLDLRMPVMNGYETISEIRKDNKLKDIPVVAITASVMDEDVNKVEQYGFNGYLRKPVQRQELFRLTMNHIPYKAEQPEEQQNITIDVSNIPREQLALFVDIVQKELLPEWHRVRDRGDFELVGQFASRLRKQSISNGIERIAQYAEELELHVNSFDILEVDSLMKQFPTLVQALTGKNENLERG